ncbi:TPA: hypothetical protein JAN90_02835 [Legionella pneumophila]|uniref:hypothetical protein n=1 Tax=Legionella sp. PATHC039 TaxID=2992042 RepID=UPI0007783F2F|nr:MULTISPECIES: hypothetical protein [Legionella]HAT8857277.1 hypothetical protein [Legionella pneumophila subsp. pneumophila]MCW8394918.1 hypothetical protein [Legionella sp. PATHC039]HAT7071721.1 hypothetical protein [Legionella pneumophila]HAT8640140.1 hypothetical protein [Legionella pneumophila]HAT8643263.1 hypothetical protein [Legionella pneumophila]
MRVSKKNCDLYKSNYYDTLKKRELYHAIFTSQQEQIPYSEAGCGVASLLMLLKLIQFYPLPTWKELCEALRLDEQFKKHYTGIACQILKKELF